MTDREREALTILREFPGIRATAFAKKFWPGHDMLLRPKNGGNGSQKGKGAWLAAGSYIAKLSKKGWVRHLWDTGGYMLTEKGKEALKGETPA
jgi:hypothetical protein